MDIMTNPKEGDWPLIVNMKSLDDLAFRAKKRPKSCVYEGHDGEDQNGRKKATSPVVNCQLMLFSKFKAVFRHPKLTKIRPKRGT